MFKNLFSQYVNTVVKYAITIMYTILSGTVPLEFWLGEHAHASEEGINVAAATRLNHVF